MAMGSSGPVPANTPVRRGRPSKSVIWSLPNSLLDLKDNSREEDPQTRFWPENRAEIILLKPGSLSQFGPFSFGLSTTICPGSTGQILLWEVLGEFTMVLWEFSWADLPTTPVPVRPEERCAHSLQWVPLHSARDDKLNE